MTVHTQMEGGQMKDLSMTSKILVIANASWQPFKKNLGPNSLYLLMEEEKKAIIRIKDYFAGMNIPYDFEVITTSPLETVLKKMKSRDHGVIVLQGEFIKIWREDQVNDGLCSQAISKLSRPILVINKSMEGSLSYPEFDSKISK